MALLVGGWVAVLTTSALKAGAKSLVGWNDLPKAVPRQAAARDLADPVAVPRGTGAGSRLEGWPLVARLRRPFLPLSLMPPQAVLRGQSGSAVTPVGGVST